MDNLSNEEKMKKIIEMNKQEAIKNGEEKKE